LLDSAADICAAVQQVLSEHVSEPLPFEYLKSFVGFHLDEVFTDVLPEATREQLDDLISRYKSTYLARKHASTRLYPGVVEALANLGGRKATATTKGTPTTRAVLDQFGLLSYFDHVQGTDGFPCKPAPDVLRYGPGVPAAVAPPASAAERIWRTGPVPDAPRRRPRWRRALGSAVTVLRPGM